MKYTVIIVDDSPFYREFLRECVESIEEFEVVSTAIDAYDAREKIKKYDPDLLLIDINMPKMDGVTFLKNVMRLRPMPSFIVSTEIGRDREVYEEGALAFIAKKTDIEMQEEFLKRLKDTLLRFSYLYDRYREKRGVKQGANELKVHPDKLLAKNPSPGASKNIIAIGASTGGVEAIKYLFSELPPTLPPIVVAQHIPYGFSKNFANRLNTDSKISVSEVVEPMELRSGCAYIASGNTHMVVYKCEVSRKYFVAPLEGERICYQKPSINILFRSVNNTFGKSATAIILTGMGDDGSIGIKELYDNGAYTIAQDEKSSIVFGMPKKAIESGGVVDVLPLSLIPKRVVEIFK